jgi:hypothetical protein
MRQSERGRMRGASRRVGDERAALPSLVSLNWFAAYWPSSSMFAVWTPSVTVSVPLRLLPASAKLTCVPDPNATSRRSSRSPE